MNRLEVIGAGPGAGDMLTLRARAAIDGAQAVWCAERTEELLDGRPGGEALEGGGID